MYRDTVLEFKNDHVMQKVENLVMHTVATIEGDGYKNISNTTVYLDEGDILIFEEEGRGYIKPAEDIFTTIAGAIEDLTNIKDLGEE